ncbi:unnamed protein product [Lasius platythorax]|uniref:Uncharacterized protein n=1 Tax=Lasius platythorax TaxID=488582 RepID=A0AAV2MYQ8_9HYME
MQELPGMEVDNRQEMEGIEEQQNTQEAEGEVEEKADQDFEEEREQEVIAADDYQEMDAVNDESDYDILEEDNLKKFLSNWSVQYNIPHVALKSLLRKLISCTCKFALGSAVIIKYAEEYRNKNCSSRRILPCGPIKGG